MRQEFSVSQPGDGPFLIVGTYLPLRSFWKMPVFFLLAGRVTKQMRTTPGVVRTGTMAKLSTKEFWTCSVWRAGSEQAIEDFVHSGAHIEALEKNAQWSTGKEAFARWTSASPAIDWNELRRRLPPRG